MRLNTKYDPDEGEFYKEGHEYNRQGRKRFYHEGAKSTEKKLNL
jgi:hypothetical protein